MAVKDLTVWVPADEQFPPFWRPNGTYDHVSVRVISVITTFHLNVIGADLTSSLAKGDAVQRMCVLGGRTFNCNGASEIIMYIDSMNVSEEGSSQSEAALALANQSNG